MGMKKCPECGNAISDRLKKCPNCGYPAESRSDRYSQFYEKPKQNQLYQPEPNYIEDREEKRAAQSNTKSTSLSISAMILSFMGLLTSFMAIIIASSKPKEIYIEKEVPVYQEDVKEIALEENVVEKIGVSETESNTIDIEENEAEDFDFPYTNTYSEEEISIEEENIQEELETDSAKKDDIPTEYKSALQKAISYSDSMNMSKRAIYDQLTSEYGEKFSEDAAQYAIENIEADWKGNALKKARSYQDEMDMSPAAIYDQLISEYGERFTEEEAQYAIDNLE